VGIDHVEIEFPLGVRNMYWGSIVTGMYRRGSGMVAQCIINALINFLVKKWPGLELSYSYYWSSSWYQKALY